MFKNNFFNFFNNIPFFKKDQKMLETELQLQEFLISETIEHNLSYALSSNQLLVSKGIFDVFKTPNLIKTVQLISQPQVGKTGTILHALAQIKIYGQEKYSDKKFRIVFIQPSDNELKEQLKDRLKNFKFKNPKTNKFECLEDYESCTDPYKIYTTADFAKTKNEENIKSIQLANLIQNWRENQDIIIFVHDESHRDCGENGTFDKFFNENEVYFWGLVEGQTVHDNYDNELYLKISASAANFLRTAKNTTKHEPIAFYLKPNSSYVSFKDLLNEDRIKEGFKIKNKQEVRKFLIECLCENFLINEPGCFIVRLGQNNSKKRSDTENSNLFKSIQNEIDYFLKHKNELKEQLIENKNITPFQINLVLENIEKLKTFLFISQNKNNPMFKKYPEIFIKDQQEEEIKFKKYDDNKKIKTENDQNELINSINSNENVLEIGMMRYFLKDHTQNGNFKVLFIVNSFLQGKTLNLNNVKGWFERYAEDVDTANDAFTIQSIGRNCGNHREKEYEYPIWTNLKLIEGLSYHYDTIIANTDILTSKIKDFKNIADISSTYIKAVSNKSQKKKEFKLQNPNSLNTYEFDVKVCNTKEEAIIEIENHFQKNQFSLTDISYHVQNETKHVDYLKKYKTKEQQTLNPYVPIDKQSFNLNDFFNRNTYSAKISDQTKKNAIAIVDSGKYARFCHTSGGSRNFHEEFPDGFRYGIIELDGPANNTEYQQTWNSIIEENVNHPLYKKQGCFIAYFERELISHQDKIKNDNQRIMIDVGSVDRRFI